MKTSKFVFETNEFSYFSMSVINIHLVFLNSHFPNQTFTVFDLEEPLLFSNSLPTYYDIKHSTSKLKVKNKIAFLMSVTFTVNLFISKELNKFSDLISFEQKLRLIKHQFQGKGTFTYSFIIIHYQLYTTHYEG